MDKEASKYRPPEVDLCAVNPKEAIIQQYEVLQQLILRTSEKAVRYSVPIVFVLAPSIAQVQDASWNMIEKYDPEIMLQRNLPNQQLMAFAKEHNLTMLDLLPVLRQAAENGEPLYNQFEQHWTVRGNEVAAKSILEFIPEL